MVRFTILAVVCWSISDVSSSVLVRDYEKDPVILSWVESTFGVTFLILFSAFFWGQLDVSAGWFLAFILVGLLSYAAWLLYFYVVTHIDLSVMSAAWAMKAIFISLTGFLLFGERWSGLQSVGALLVLIGVFALACWHKHVSIPRTLFLLSALGLLYAPYFVVQKMALLNGLSIRTVFFWPYASAGCTALLFPLFQKTYRAHIAAICRGANLVFYALCFLASACSLLGFYLITRAYAVGYASIVSISENALPFFILTFAWVLSRVAPRFAPRELLTAQSVQVKLVSFVVVFAGLGLLVVG